jgi:hypothetical protein
MPVTDEYIDELQRRHGDSPELQELRSRYGSQSSQIKIDPEVIAKKRTSEVFGTIFGLDEPTTISTYDTLVKNMYGESLSPSQVQKMMEEDGFRISPEGDEKDGREFTTSALDRKDSPVSAQRQRREANRQVYNVFQALQLADDIIFEPENEWYKTNIATKPKAKSGTVYSEPIYEPEDLLDFDTYASLLEQSATQENVQDLRRERKALLARKYNDAFQETADYYDIQEWSEFSTGSKAQDVTLEAAKGIYTALKTVERGVWSTSVAMGMAWNQPNLDDVETALKDAKLTPMKAAGKIGYVTRAMSEAIPNFAYNMTIGNSGIFITEYGNAKQDALNDGATDFEADAIAIPVATINTIIEGWQIDKIFKVAGLGKGAKQAVKQAIKDRSYKAFIKGGAKFTGQSVLAAINEGIEGFTQEGVSIAVPGFIIGNYPKDENGRIDWAGIMSRMGQSFVGEGLGGLLIGTGGAVYNARNVQNYKHDLAFNLITNEGMESKQAIEVATNIVERLRNNEAAPKEIYREEVGKVKMADNRAKAAAHIIKKGKEIPDEQYRQIAMDTTGKDSMVDMTYEEGEKFIEALNQAKVEKVEPVEGEVKEEVTEQQIVAEITAIRDEGGLPGPAAEQVAPKPGTKLAARKGYSYRAFDRADEATGKDVSVGRNTVEWFEGDPFLIEIEGKQGKAIPHHKGAARGDITGANVTTVYYLPDAMVAEAQEEYFGDSPDSELSKLKEQFPNANFVKLESIDGPEGVEYQVAQPPAPPAAEGVKQAEAVVKESLTTQGTEPKESWQMTREEYGQSSQIDKKVIPEVAQPTIRDTVQIEVTTLSGPKKKRAKRYWLPGYNGPDIAVVESKSPKGRAQPKTYTVYLADSGVFLESSNGVSNLESTLKQAIQRLRSYQNKGVSPSDLAHKEIVFRAIKEGKPVPRAVLEEYKSEKWAQDALAKLEAKPAKTPKQQTERGFGLRGGFLSNTPFGNKDKLQDRVDEVLSLAAKPEKPSIEEGKKSLKELKKTDTITTFKNVAEDAVKGIDRAFGIMSTRIKNISQKLFQEVRNKYINPVKMIIADRTTKVHPFVDGIGKLSEADAYDFEVARWKGDVDTVERIIEKYGLQESYDKYRLVFDLMYHEGKAVGMDMNYRTAYFPSKVKDLSGLLKELNRREEYAPIVKALQDAQDKKGRPLSTEEQIQVLDTLLRGYRTTSVSLTPPGFTRIRTLIHDDISLIKYYYGFAETTSRYIESMTENIQARKFFGKQTKEIVQLRANISRTKTNIAKWEKDTEKDRSKNIQKAKARLQEYETKLLQLDDGTLNASVGNYVLDLITDGTINYDQQVELRQIFDGLFNTVGSNRWVHTLRSLEYVSSLAQVPALVTQYSEVILSILKSPASTLPNWVRAHLNKSKINLHDIGVAHIGQEWADADLNNTMTTLMKAFEKVDAIGKETFVNSVIDKYRKMAKTNPDKVREELSKYYPESEHDAIIESLISGVVDNNIKGFALNELADVQPISKMEVPELYAKAGNLRVFYMYKTFTLKRLDILRNQAYGDIKTGVKSGSGRLILKGLGKLVWLALMFTLADASADVVKDVIRGRPIQEIDDYIVDNLLQMILLSKYSATKVRREGLSAFFRDNISLPVSTVDAAAKDLFTLLDEDSEKGSELAKRIPWIGDLYYWYMGEGARKVEEGYYEK